MRATASAGQAVEFRADDGEHLHGRVFEPDGRAAGQVLVAGGLGVAQRFYAPLTTWLAASGHRVQTFDLRGMGASRRPEHRQSLRGLDADMLTWARRDFAAAVRWLADAAEGARIGLIGHSLGVHHAAMTDARTQAHIAVAVSVAAGSGYWRDWAAPLLTPLFGCFPGKRLRMVGDLPGPAMRPWSTWCRHPEFAWGAEPDLVVPACGRPRSGSRLSASRTTTP